MNNDNYSMDRYFTFNGYLNVKFCKIVELRKNFKKFLKKFLKNGMFLTKITWKLEKYKNTENDEVAFCAGG